MYGRGGLRLTFQFLGHISSPSYTSHGAFVGTDLSDRFCHMCALVVSES
jgi:hypothetical protein